MPKEDILDYMDEEDYLAILSIGRDAISHTKIQKIAYMLSNVTGLKGKFAPHDYGDFSESIMEKIQSPHNRDIFSVSNESYSLTKKGEEIYRGILNSLGPEKQQSIENLITILHKMNSEKLEALTYHLFPEMAVNSRVKFKIELITKDLKSRDKIKAERKNDTIIFAIE